MKLCVPATEEIFVVHALLLVLLCGFVARLTFEPLSISGLLTTPGQESSCNRLVGGPSPSIVFDLVALQAIAPTTFPAFPFLLVEGRFIYMDTGRHASYGRLFTLLTSESINFFEYLVFTSTCAIICAMWRSNPSSVALACACVIRETAV